MTTQQIALIIQILEKLKSHILIRLISFTSHFFNIPILEPVLGIPKYSIPCKQKGP